MYILAERTRIHGFKGKATEKSKKNGKNDKNTPLNGYFGQKIEIKKSGSTKTSTIFQLVYMPNFRAIRQTIRLGEKQ